MRNAIGGARALLGLEFGPAVARAYGDREGIGRPSF